jgi:ribosomal protein S27AE
MPTTTARCPDCGQAVTTPADASGPTSRHCPRCGDVLLLFTPRLDRQPPTATEAATGGDGRDASRRRWAWRR